MSTDPRVDAYIARQADFARPILEHLRFAVHSACPEAEETLKWGMPHFLYKGQMLAGMAAFKAHATFGFRRAKEVLGETGAEREAMGQFGRLTGVADLPPDEALHEMVRKAMAVTDSGTRPARSKGAPKPELQTPPELDAALNENPAARATFDGFPPSCRREYVEWVAEAKRPETRVKRIAQAVEWMTEGKRRNWKYEKC
ncbi:MAG TPA: YdeI/OmpD-associated family protein [Allosphingosinicella sp.]|nr:YdeI/OmpD-associated family protein [Allosphingosinicella sp.]